MKAAIFTLDTESYKARKASAAGMVLKKLLEQSGFETAAVRVIPKDRKVAASVLKRVAEEQTAELVLTERLCSICTDGCGRTPSSGNSGDTACIPQPGFSAGGSGLQCGRCVQKDADGKSSGRCQRGKGSTGIYSSGIKTCD